MALSDVILFFFVSVFWYVIALTSASMTLNVITVTQGIVATEFTEPERIVLFLGDERELNVDYRSNFF